MTARKTEWAAAIRWGVDMGLISFPLRQVNIMNLDKKTGRERVSRDQRIARHKAVVKALWDQDKGEWKDPQLRTAEEQRALVLLWNYRRRCEKLGRPDEIGIPGRLRDTERTRNHLARVSNAQQQP